MKVEPARSFGDSDVDERIHSLTTIVECQLPNGLVSQGTGFFFHTLGDKLADHASEPKSQFAVTDMWIVTNRHVLMPNGECPTSIAFSLRTHDAVGAIEWITVTLSKAEVRDNLRVHPDESVDVAAFNVRDNIIEVMNSDSGVTYSGVGQNQFPEVDGFEVTVASDVIIVGYPKGFYDKINKFPIVKAGIVASRWQSNYSGQRAFLIDAKLFPGSSGSVVLTKPTDYVIRNGQVIQVPQKKYCLLGIFSGEPYEVATTPIETEDGLLYKKERFDLGLVWYYDVIPEVIQGPSLTERDKTNG